MHRHPETIRVGCQALRAASRAGAGSTIEFLKKLEHCHHSHRHVGLELRHPSWEHDDVFQLLHEHRAAYCVMSGANLSCLLRATTDFVYIRLHGPHQDDLYRGSYADGDLGWWADRIREWDRSGRDVLAYFNNDGEGDAVRNALQLKKLLDI